jgi:hypothetical protein
VTGTESTFTVETFGRPKPGGIKIDRTMSFSKGNTGLRARAASHAAKNSPNPAATTTPFSSIKRH